MKKPIILLTMGDPAGVGPEVCVEAMMNPEVRKVCRPVLVGDLSPIRAALKVRGIEASPVVIESPADLPDDENALPVISAGCLEDGEWEYGKVQLNCGKAAYTYIETAIRAAMDLDLPAVVTAPINKEAIHLAGCPHAGHTEIFASLTNTRKYAMMLSTDRLNVIHVSTHRSLSDACKAVQKDRVMEVIRLADLSVRAMGIEHPRIAVAGLNPHSGENGLFGQEEILHITPAIEECRSQSIDVTGPLPPDSVFVKAVGGAYDIVVAMYHDQGHIPIKLLGFDLTASGGKVSGVNVTVGLPFVRTSVDHGTAFDIAGTGKADANSMAEAVILAARMSRGSDQASKVNV